jgi:DNA modification methylase
MADLKELNFELSFTGFEGIEIDRLLQQFRGEAAEDAMATTAAEPVSAPGDVWSCDRHRVMCGDATSANDVAHLLKQATPALMVTDPPYGVDYDPMWREEAGLGIQRQTGAVANDDRVDWSEAFALFPGDVVYVCHAGIHAPEVASALRAASFEIRSQIIWAKQHFALSRGHYHWQHEPCWYAVRKGCSGNWRGGRKESTLWEVSNLNPFGAGQPEDAITGHGTQKPVELMRRPILNHTEEGEIIYDPFLGSGSTLIAAEQVNRVCHGLEISAAYVDGIVTRWQNLTGKEAVLEDGRVFEQVRAERQGAVAAAEGTDVAA